MATSLKRIEKEFILGAVRDDGVRVLLIAGNGEWPAAITAVDKDHLVLSHSMPQRLLRRGETYEFRFVYREQAMAFRAKLLEAKEASVSVAMPESVYKNLGRRYSRRAPPLDFAVSFSFMGDRYDLAFPTTRQFDPVSEPEPSESFDPADIRALVRDFNEKAGEYASERGIHMFKDRKPETAEERLVVRTGLCFYLPSAAGGLPLVDPYVSPRIVTRTAFADWLREQGVREGLVDEELLRYERNKKSSGVLSELLVPVVFQEYVIGCVSLQNKLPGKAPFDLGILDTFHQFAKILAYSLELNGYFRDAPKKASGFPADVIDVSAGGLLFANPSRELAGSLLPGSRLELQVKAGGRSVKAKAVLKRSYRDSELVYYGVEYDEIAPEDFRFLFEALYGRAFTDGDAQSVEGLGIKVLPDLKFD